jgi:hypothetical protein
MTTDTLIARLRDVRAHLTRGAVGIPDAETILDEILADLERSPLRARTREEVRP